MSTQASNFARDVKKSGTFEQIRQSIAETVKYYQGVRSGKAKHTFHFPDGSSACLADDKNGFFWKIKP